MWHKIWMHQNRLNKQICDKLCNITGKLNYLEQMESDLQSIRLIQEDCYDRNKLRRIIYNTIVLVAQENKKTRRRYSDEDTETHTEKRRNSWKKKTMLERSDIYLALSCSSLFVIFVITYNIITLYSWFSYNEFM